MLLPYPQQLDPTSAEEQSATGTAAGVRWVSDIDQRVAQRLTQLLPSGLGRPLTLEVEHIDSGYPQLGLDESYHLAFTTAGVSLRAPTTWGALHGVTSLWQLYVAGTLPVTGVITDHPRFAWRGVLIDVARHFLPMALLRRVVDAMARLKMNVLHLHLTDDQGFRLHSGAYPQLASTESYSAAEVRALIEFAADLGVRVVPELDVPGHVNSWLEKYPEWGLAEVAPSQKFGVHEACLNVTDERVYTALESLFGEVAALFPDDYVHIGGDVYTVTLVCTSIS
jgi:hexosaminidase